MARLLRVGIDANYLLTGGKTGVETYTAELVRALLARQEDSELHLYLNSRQRPSGLQGTQTHLHCIPAPRLWLKFWWPLHMRLDKVQVAHAPGTILPLYRPCPFLVTVYDLACLRHPELYPAAEVRIFERVVKNSIMRADGIIAISQSTKRDLVRGLGVDDGKVFVTLLGASAEYRPAAEDAVALARRRYGLEQPYLLAVGAMNRRKNYPRLLQAVALLSERGEWDGLTAIVGPPGYGAREVLEQAQAPAIRAGVRLLGYVPAEDMPALYSGAEMLVFVSVYEGFGLPALEAMACGTPVVCSESSSFPEVVGDAAVTVNPLDLEGIAEAIKRVAQGEGLRRRLREAGLRQAAKFSWAKTAELTMQAYRTVAERGSRS